MPTRKDYGKGGWEMSFTCKRCGRIRVPFEVDGSSYLAEVERLRARLISEGEIDA